MALQELMAAYDLFINDNAIPERIQQITDIFNSCLGEENVDIVKANEEPHVFRKALENFYNPQNTLGNLIKEIRIYHSAYDIIVKFDKVTLTNEVLKSTDIYDLFIKTPIAKDGTIKGYPTAKRSTFTIEQLNSEYIHSHVTSLTLSEDGLKEWHSMCFGSGPINETITALMSSHTETERWIAYITELRQWTRIESLDGGPYRKIESIHGRYKEAPIVSGTILNMAILPNNNLIKSYIRSKRLKVGFINRKFCLGTTFTEWLIDFSAYAKAWAEENNKALTFRDTLIMDNKIYIPDNATIRENILQRLVGKPVLTFKGREITLALTESEKQPEHLNLIPYEVGAKLLQTLLNKLNYLYGNNTEEESKLAPIFW